MGGYDPQTDESGSGNVNATMVGWMISGMGAIFAVVALCLAVGHFGFDVQMHSRNSGGNVSSAGVAFTATGFGLLGISMVAIGRYIRRRAQEF